MPEWALAPQKNTLPVHYHPPDTGNRRDYLLILRKREGETYREGKTV